VLAGIQLAGPLRGAVPEQAAVALRSEVGVVGPRVVGPLDRVGAAVAAAASLPSGPLQGGVLERRGQDRKVSSAIPRGPQ
jgi:hypothetical protein